MKSSMGEQTGHPRETALSFRENWPIPAPIRWARSVGIVSSPSPKRSSPLRARYLELQQHHEDLLRQLRLAEQVQRSMLPHEMPQITGVIFAGALRPTQHMAGDFYNVFRLDRNRVGFYIGDVMGHGPAAALLSVYAMLSLRTKRIEGHQYEIIEPGAVLASLNDELLKAEFPGMPFLTMVYGVLDVPGRTLTYCCGGHPHPMILSSKGGYVALEPTAPLLGIFEAAFTQRSISLNRDDRFLLYSDGALTAHWGQDSQYGLEGLASCLECRDERTLQILIDETLSTAHFETDLADDIALLAFELEPV